MRITNSTKYDTRDCRRVVIGALKAFDRKPADYKGLHVRIVYNKTLGSSWHGGRARVGRKGQITEDGVERIRLARWMTLSLPRDETKVNVAQFGATAMHEVAHLMGRRHRDFEPKLLYGDPSIAPWTAGMVIRTKPEKVVVKPGPETKLTKVQAKVEEIDRKIRRLTRRRSKLTAQVRYYEKVVKTAARPLMPRIEGNVTFTLDEPTWNKISEAVTKQN